MSMGQRSMRVGCRAERRPGLRVCSVCCAITLAAAVAGGDGCGTNSRPPVVGRDSGSTGGAGPGGTGGGITGGADGGGDCGGADGGENTTTATPFVWEDLTPCVVPKPTPIYDLAPMLAFDSDRRKLIFYDGFPRNASLDDVIPGPPAGNLWEMDAVTGAWTDRTLCPPVPFYTDNGSMIYDSRHRRAVVFAGQYVGVAEWDPSTGAWTDRQPGGTVGGSPSGFPRTSVYEEVRGKVMVFVRDDEKVVAWEWDTTTGAWTARTELPLFRFPSEKPAVAYDSDRDVVWMFGGGGPDLYDHMWRWDVGDPAAEPVDITPAQRPVAWPSERVGSGLVYDTGRKRLVLYAGVFTDYLRDLWEWDPEAATWQDRTPAGVPASGGTVDTGVVWPPAGLDANRIFFDPVAKQILLYVWNDNARRWAWDGATGTWSVAAPSATQGWPTSAPTATAWNDDDGSLLLWADADLWRWSPQSTTVWELQTPPAVAALLPAERDPASWPGARFDTAVAYDRDAKKLVIFGGQDANGFLDDLWLWDSATRQIAEVPRPSGAAWPTGRSGHGLAYDPIGKRVLLFGGGTADPSDALWALDTHSMRWEELTPPVSGRAANWPTARRGHGFVFDEERRVLVLAGGSSSDAALADIWELDGGGTTWRRIADGGDGVTGWPLIRSGDAMAYAPGLGIYAAAATRLTDEALWQWDTVARVWKSHGLTLPRTTAPAYSLSLAGIDKGLLYLFAGAVDRLPEDETFWETWRGTVAGN